MKVEISASGRTIIICEDWKEADGLTPVAGVTVEIPSDNGKFTWYNMWNPFSRKYQIVRG